MQPGTHLTNPDGSHSENCFLCRLRTVQIAPAGRVAQERAKDATLAENMDAYKRLRIDGLQPKSIVTAAKMEKEANEPFEVETGRLVPDASDRQRYVEAFASIPPPCSTPIVREEASA